jgi:23S rRNA (guanosine2251-2'-O)-methyltransferase
LLTQTGTLTEEYIFHLSAQTISTAISCILKLNQEIIANMSLQNSEIIYGIHPAEELFKTRPGSIHRVYFAKPEASDLFNLMKQCRKDRIPYQIVPPNKLAELASSFNHQGVVVQCGLKEYEDSDALVARLDSQNHTPLLLVPASIEDPRNLGALIRSSVAFGVDAVLMERKHSVHPGATVSKASAGMLEHVSIARPRNLEGFLTERKEKGYCIVGAEAGSAKKPHEIDFKQPTILILGGEHRGIPPYLHQLCTDFVTIPTSATVPSLNVSAAASILLYECARQRGPS